MTVNTGGRPMRWEYSIDALRAECMTLAQKLVERGRAYDRRERQIRDMVESGKLLGDIRTHLKSDLLLNDHAGASRTIGTVLAALAATLDAELAYQRRVDEASRSGPWDSPPERYFLG